MISFISPISWISIVACQPDKELESPPTTTQEATPEVLDLDDQWWQNETEDPYQNRDSEEENTDEEESVFWGILYADGAYGFSGLYDAGHCEWEAELNGQPTTLCPDCAQAYTITFAVIEVVNDDNCPEELTPAGIDGLTINIGFGGEIAWLQEEGSWEEFGYAFVEDDGIGWYVPL